jgi:hypothetical protein
MSTFMSSPCRDVTCAAGATLITLALGMTFLQTNSTPKPVHPTTTGSTPIELHGWVGQPKPAVLVD